MELAGSREGTRRVGIRGYNGGEEKIWRVAG